MGYYFGKDMTANRRSVSGGAQGKSGGKTISLRDAINRVMADTGSPSPVSTNLVSSSRSPIGVRRISPRGPTSILGGGGIDTHRLREPEPDIPEENIPEELGEWRWPQEMDDLYRMLVGRSDELLRGDYGLSPEEIAAMFGKDFENIRAGEGASREMLQGNLASQGMLNTGTETDAMIRLALGTEKNVGDLQRQLLLENEAQKLRDLQTYADLFRSLGEYNTIAEGLNAGRRGEANNMLNLLLQYYVASQGGGG